MPRKVFVAGEILTAADVNTNLMDQSVMVFDDAAARTTAIPTPVEGMVTYLKDTNLVQAFTGSAFTAVGGILQVVSTTKTDTFTSASTTYVDITGLTATITPSSTTSKIFVMVDIPMVSSSDDSAGFLQLLRDSTVVTKASAGATNTSEAFMAFGGLNFTGSDRIREAVPFSFLDSPGSTSALVYKIRGRKETGGSFRVNRWQLSDFISSVSSITLMEVAG